MMTKQEILQHFAPVRFHLFVERRRAWTIAQVVVEVFAANYYAEIYQLHLN